MKLIFSLLLACAAIVCKAQHNPMVADESGTDASFLKFKQQLQTAVEKQDASLILPLLADSVRESANGPCTYCPKNVFMEMCVLPETDNYFWQQAALLLRYGFKKGSTGNPTYIAARIKAAEYFTAPAFTVEASNIDSVLILVDNATLHSAPFADSPVVATVSYERLATCAAKTEETPQHDFYIYNADEETGWVCVELPTGLTGYVRENETSMPLFKEMTVAKINDRWQIVSFYHPPGC